MIYIYKNDQQSGPYEDHIVLEQLRTGVLSPSDLGVRHGETNWQPLSDMFPEVTLPTPAAPPAPEVVTSPSPRPEPTPAAVEPAASSPLYRRTFIQKFLFGLLFLGFFAALIGCAVYFYGLRSPSGDLATDLRNGHFRDLFLYASIGLFVGTFFSFIAFLLTFKRKVISSNAFRLIIRTFFILVLLAGVVELGVGLGAYFMYTKPYVSSTTKPEDKNELLKAMEEGEAAAGPYKGPVTHIPISVGLVLLGLSGILMTTKRGKAAA